MKALRAALSLVGLLAARPSARGALLAQLVALVLLLAQTSCASRSRPPAGFDLEAFTRSRTTLGGVASRVHYSDGGLGTATFVTSLMEATFMKQRRDLNFVLAEVLRVRIGEGPYGELIDRYRDGAGIDSSTYVVLATAMGPDANFATDNNKVTKSTYRNVWLTCSLFDLEARREIWSESRAGRTSNDVSFDEKPGSGVWGLVKAIFTSEPDHPQAPGADRAVEKAFSRIAKDIPRR